MNNVALVDGDMLLYLAGFSAQRKIYTLRAQHIDGYVYEESFYSKMEAMTAKEQEIEAFGEDKVTATISESTEVFPLDVATHVIEDVLTTTARNTACSDLVVFLSGPNELCFRSSVSTIRPYKGHRESAERPVHYHALKAYLLTKHNANMCYWHEADDALAMMANGNIMCTADKDLLQVPGVHYNFFTHEGREISHLEGEYNLFHQILTGDPVDNIQGLRGVGEKRAANALEDAKDDPRAMYAVCLEMYTERWPEDHPLSGEEAFQETAELVYLLREYGDSWSNRQRQHYL